MILSIGDWRLLVDEDTTSAYSDTEAAEHCGCGYCRNFYAAVDAVYPKLRPFLAQFGINIEAPDELIPYTPTLYQACYGVAGVILQEGSLTHKVDGLSIRMDSAEDVDMNTGIDGPHFFVTVGLMELPWVLDEPMEDVISPANELSFMEKMFGGIPQNPNSNNSYS